MGTLGRGAHAVDWPPTPTSGPGLVRTSVSRATTLSPTTSPVAVIPNHPPSYVPVKPHAHALEGGADQAKDAEADGDLLEAGEEAIVAVVLGDASEHEGDQGRALIPVSRHGPRPARPGRLVAAPAGAGPAGSAMPPGGAEWHAQCSSVAIRWPEVPA